MGHNGWAQAAPGSIVAPQVVLIRGAIWKNHILVYSVYFSASVDSQWFDVLQNWCSSLLQPAKSPVMVLQETHNVISKFGSFLDFRHSRLKDDKF